ncbi:MAG: alpha/beta fold hydrolase [Candidatus Eremiobacterota bacterium]
MIQSCSLHRIAPVLLPAAGSAEPPEGPRDGTEVSPVLFVHGFGGWVAEFDVMAAELSGRPVGQGIDAVFETGKEAEFRQAVRRHGAAGFYAIRFSQPRCSYRRLAPELEAAVRILREETGRPVDVVSHSMGGLVTRRVLDAGREEVRRLVMVATPNQGTRNATLGHLACRLAPAERVFPGINEALVDLSPVSDGRNPALAGMNLNWTAQRERCDQVMTIMAECLPTPAVHGFGLEPGDGVVPAASCPMPGARHVVVSPRWTVPLDCNHKWLLRHPEVVEAVGTFLDRKA